MNQFDLLYNLCKNPDNLIRIYELIGFCTSNSNFISDYEEIKSKKIDQLRFLVPSDYLLKNNQN
jgi:hypothetical protein